MTDVVSRRGNTSRTTRNAKDGGTPRGKHYRPALFEPVPPTIEELVAKAQQGDPEAFAQIYDRYADRIFKFVYYRVSGNRQLAEDLTSDTFLRALKRISSFTWQGSDLGAWLTTIARNIVVDYFKSGRNRLEVVTGDVFESEHVDNSGEGHPEDLVIGHLTNLDLIGAVLKLNPDQRECIVLRFLQGLSVSETALAMDRNEGAVKALQYRAVRALGRLLPEGFSPTLEGGSA